MKEKRSSFSGKLGFILACAGSAVGLGNLWRFPYLAAKYGGGIFLLVYIILAITFGFSLLLLEIAIGRKTGLSVIGAFSELNKKFSFIGYLCALIPLLVLPYYSVIGGWVVKYLAAFLSGNGSNSAGDTYFEAFISGNFQPIFYFLVFLALTAIVVLLGVEKGIERLSKLLMPALLILSVIITVYVILLPEAKEGIIYYLKPDLSKLSLLTVASAMGQLFCSMSLSMGIMITYGSYTKKDIDLEGTVKSIELFDLVIAFLAGLMVIPSVFAFSGGEIKKGPSLMFVTLPKVFNSIIGGQFIGALFFILVLLAALTSSISMMEALVSIIQDKYKISRKFTCLIVLVSCFILGVPSALGYGTFGGIKILGMQFLDFFDFLSNNILMPIVAILTCIFIGFITTPRPIIEEIELNGKFKKKRLFTLMIKYIAPVFLVIILATSILEVAGIITI